MQSWRKKIFTLTVCNLLVWIAAAHLGGRLAGSGSSEGAERSASSGGEGQRSGRASMRRLPHQHFEDGSGASAIPGTVEGHGLLHDWPGSTSDARRGRGCDCFSCFERRRQWAAPTAQRTQASPAGTTNRCRKGRAKPYFNGLASSATTWQRRPRNCLQRSGAL